jgi:hypothetical protein
MAGMILRNFRERAECEPPPCKVQALRQSLSAVGGVCEAAGQRDAVNRAVARDKLVATSVIIPG